MQLTTQSLADIIPKDNRQEATLSPKLIMTAVANYYDIDLEGLTGKRRDKKTVLARQVAMYLLREQNHCGLAEIGKILGGRDHTTIMHGCEKITTEIDTNPQLRNSIKEIRQNLKPRRASSAS
jgi:chromosomal replication initiator protein